MEYLEKVRSQFLSLRHENWQHVDLIYFFKEEASLYHIVPHIFF
jgi:hypothetical protein